MIIDAHAHLGHDYVFDEEITEEELITQYRKDHVDGAIIQPFISRPYIEETKAYHNRIAEFCDAGKGLFYGMASINPHFKDEEVYDELKRCVKELGFVGVKITPIAHAVNPASKDGMKIFHMARELKITVMVHTGSGAPFSDPMMILPAAKQFPDVKIVIAHAGTDLLKSEAVFLTKTYDQIYIEPSWLGISATKAVIESCGVNKVMFSSDHPHNVPMELLKYRNLISDSEDLERVLSGTVIEAFELKTK